ncbi:MAG: SPOR domain-containing protein [Firmicutes bacterium]|nr:SPOR domain-containing protein [Bacillota bacterium]
MGRRRATKHSEGNDFFWLKVIVLTIVVILGSLLLGNWLGRYAIESGILSKKMHIESTESKTEPDAAVETTPTAAPKPVNTPRKPKTEAKSAPVKQSSPKETASPKIIETPKKTPEQPAPAKTVEKPPSASVSEKGYLIQTGVFSNEDYAKDLQNQLKSAGKEAAIEKISKSGAVFYRVSVGNYKTRGDAEKDSEELKGKGFEALIIER